MISGSIFFGDSLLQVASLKKDFGFSKLGFVVFLTSLVHVSVGTAHWHEVSIPKLLVPLTIWKNPFSPQYDPHEFLPIQ